MDFNRRAFLETTLAMGIGFSVTTGFSANQSMNKSTDTTKLIGRPTKDGASIVYRSVNGNLEQNLRKVIELIGGIEKIIGSDDVVLTKPNVQWWNQGAPNLAALKAFVDLIMERPGGFKGEVVLAENCHRGASPWTSIDSGWTNCRGPLFPILVKYTESNGGYLDETKVEVKSYDFKTKAFQKNDELVVSAPTHWGSDPKAILKYLVLGIGIKIKLITLQVLHYKPYHRNTF